MTSFGGPRTALIALAAYPPTRRHEGKSTQTPKVVPDSGTHATASIRRCYRYGLGQFQPQYLGLAGTVLGLVAQLDAEAGVLRKEDNYVVTPEFHALIKRRNLYRWG